MIEVKKYQTPAEEFPVIAEKYNLAVQSHGSTTWITLKVPEAGLKVIWFKE